MEAVKLVGMGCIVKQELSLEKIKKHKMPQDFLPQIERELKTIKKSLIKKVELYIAKHPFATIFISIIVGIGVNLFSSWLWGYF